MDINSVSLVGRLTKDPNKVSDKLTVFTLAVNVSKDDAMFIDCKAPGKTGELIGQYLQKGSQCAITGKLTMDKWEKDGNKFSKIGIFVANCQFLAKSKEQGNQAPPVNDPQVDAGDIPF